MQVNSTNLLADQILATIYGQCVGDALGLLTEFMSKKEAKKYYGNKPRNLEYSQKVPDFHRSRWAEGDWTDDSDHMFVILQSILYNKGEVIATDFAVRIKRWMRKGFPDLGDVAGMGIGATTKAVLSHGSFTTDPHKIASECWENSQRNIAPNGAVMRTSILGIHQWDDLDSVFRNTLEICKTTHYDPRCQASTVATTTCIALMLQQTAHHGDGKKLSKNVDLLIKQSYDTACKVLETDEQKQELWFYMSCTKLKQLQLAEPGKIGYTYKCLGAGFWAFKQDNFKKALIKVVMEFYFHDI
uniref:ADP-ribosylglycohydrolase n=1 Tax=Arion vulgaris TaxID=1028688 RepID=A0A0B7BD36_9EUPU